MNESENQFLGFRIRTLRKGRNVTLAQLASQCGLSIGYISQLERGLAYPSIPALIKISQALKVTVQWFFAARQEPVHPDDLGYITRKNSRTQVVYDDGVVDEFMSFSEDRQLEMLISRFPAGEYSEESYVHEGEEAGYVIEGTFELWVGARHFVLEAGDAFGFSSTEPHRYGNPGPTETKIIWVITPPTY
ncbi:MAG: cupin domain-containing protein [Neisseriaceae bacterium]|nr:cupin domain-containing protein [Neisseriaceae bacterium]MBP6862743.1 cupin domain-containing protein [Neisseriaceae bacterium]